MKVHLTLRKVSSTSNSEAGIGTHYCEMLFNGFECHPNQLLYESKTLMLHPNSEKNRVGIYTVIGVFLLLLFFFTATFLTSSRCERGQGHKVLTGKIFNQVELRCLLVSTKKGMVRAI